MTAEQRLQLIPRIVRLLYVEIERNGGRYDGRMVPNLTSIGNMCEASDEALAGIEEKLAALEAERGVTP